MSRKLPTGRLTPLGGAHARVSLVVDYEDDQDFLADYEHTLVGGEAIVQAARLVDVGTPVQLGLSFPGLVEPIVIDGVVRDHNMDSESTWMNVELSGSANAAKAQIEIEQGGRGRGGISREEDHPQKGPVRGGSRRLGCGPLDRAG